MKTTTTISAFALACAISLTSSLAFAMSYGTSQDSGAMDANAKMHHMKRQKMMHRSHMKKMRGGMGMNNGMNNGMSGGMNNGMSGGMKNNGMMEKKM